MISFEVELAGHEIIANPQGWAFLPPAVTNDMFGLELKGTHMDGALKFGSAVSITVDNHLSPSHTALHIVCQDHKGLIYDIMRTLKDFNIQVLIYVLISQFSHTEICFFFCHKINISDFYHAKRLVIKFI